MDPVFLACQSVSDLPEYKRSIIQQQFTGKLVNVMSEEKEKIADGVMKEMEKRLNENKDLTEGWGKTVQTVFTDIGIGYQIIFAMDGSVHSEKKSASETKLEDAEATVFCTVDTLKDVLDGKANAMEAMAAGRFKIEGGMNALMKLAPAIM